MHASLHKHVTRYMWMCYTVDHNIYIYIYVYIYNRVVYSAQYLTHNLSGCIGPKLRTHEASRVGDDAQGLLSTDAVFGGDI